MVIIASALLQAVFCVLLLVLVALLALSAEWSGGRRNPGNILSKVSCRRASRSLLSSHSQSVLTTHSNSTGCIYREVLKYG